MVRLARSALAVVLLLVTLGLSAALAPGSGASGPSSGAARHVVVFDGALAPPDLVPRVDALGGTVLRLLGDTGVAVVGGLTDVAARELRAAPGVAAVEPDLIVSAADLSEPAAADDA